MNPLLIPSSLKHQAIDFNSIKVDHYIPALEIAIAEARSNLEKLKNNPIEDFHIIVNETEHLDDKVQTINFVFQAVHAAHCTEAINAISEKMTELSTNFYSDLMLDEKFFKKIKKCYDNKANFKLTKEEETVLKNHYKSFIRNGALLGPEQKEKIKIIDSRLSQLSLLFSENVRKATNAFEFVIDKKEDLDGLPDSAIEAAAEVAEKKGQAGKWIFTLHGPSLMPFLTYAKKRALRQKMLTASGSRAFGGELDNQKNILEIVKLRHERANLLGYPTHAAFVLEERMAGSSEKVMKLLNDLLIKSKPAAMSEKKKLEDLQFDNEKIRDLQKYDSAFYSELLKKKELGFDEDALRPYFQLDKVIEGVFKVSSKLYNLSFNELKDVPVYHEDVKVYEVFENNKFIGLFYADFFPRETKQPGAWMTNLVAQRKNEVPHVMIVCNFTKPTKTKPSLLSLDEVLTLFHEFGHSLHGLLSKCTYRSVSGTSVFWDFVELPSQIFENWVLEKECLDLFAAHYETGEKIPADMISKIKANQQFLEGLATLRQLQLGFLDMAWHSSDPNKIPDVDQFEKDTLKNFNLFPDLPGSSTSSSFSHIFAGGYSAGYYSYKWAEVLDADAFDYFKEKGIFNQSIALSFKENILSKGGSEHPMDLYKRFRGQEPSVDALLKRSGLI